MCLSRSSQLYLLCTCQTCTFGGLLKDCRQKGLLSFCEAFVGKTITEEKGRFDKDVCMAYSNSSLSKLRSNLTNFSGHEQCQHCLNFYNENPTPQVHLHLHSTMPSKYFYTRILTPKGQLISKCPLGVIVLTKKPTKFF